YQLEVSYPKTGRPGIGAPFQIQIQKHGGFDGPVTVSMSNDYLDILDVRNIVPDAQQSTSSDKAVTWQFNQPPGDTLGITISGAFLAVGTIAGLVAISSAISYFWPKSRHVLEGMPVIVIRDGRVIDEALRTERIPIDELLEEARREGIEDLRKVKVGIVETDG